MQVDPNAGLKLSEGVAKAANTKSQEELHQSEVFEKKNALADQARSAALQAYDTDLKNGVPEPQAKINAQTVYSEGVDGLKKSGIFSKDEADQMPHDFDPLRMRANSTKYQAWKEKQKADELAQQKADDAAKRSEADLKERTRHDEALEKSAQQKINIQIGNANAAPALDDTAVQYAADQYRLHGTLPPMGMGKSAAQLRQMIIERAASNAKAAGGGAGADAARQTDFKATSAGMQNLGKMRASVSQAEGNAGKEADLTLSLLDKGGLPGGPSALGKWVQGTRTGVFNNPDASAFQTAVESLKNEYVKVLSTTGGMSGGMSSDAARREADQYINPRLSKAQIKANIAVMRQSMKNRTAAINEAYDAQQKHLKELDPAADRGGKAAPHFVYDPKTGKLEAQ